MIARQRELRAHLLHVIARVCGVHAYPEVISAVGTIGERRGFLIPIIFGMLNALTNFRTTACMVSSGLVASFLSRMQTVMLRMADEFDRDPEYVDAKPAVRS